MAKKLVLLFSGNGANDAIRGLMSEYGDALTSVGISVLIIEPAEMQYAVDQISQGNVGFAVTWVGFGQDISVTIGPGGDPANIWEFFRIPLLKLHGDLPAYYSDRHGNVPTTSVNLYHAEEFAHFRRRWMPEARTLAAVIPPLPLSPVDRGNLDMSLRRRGKLVFLKNGNSPEQLQRLWNDRLPASVAKLVLSLADSITPKGLEAGRLDIGDFTADFLTSEGLDPNTMYDMQLFLSAQMDDYLRRVKSKMIAEALLDLPVIIQGGHLEHIDFIGRKAQCIAGQDFGATKQVFANQFGIIDMSPNVDTWPHDRVQRAAGTYALLLTNRQTWVTEKFPGFEDLTFGFDPESIRNRVSDAIARPSHYLELAVAFGDRFRENYTREFFANRIVDMAELAALQYSIEKPVIQTFFGWPKH
jgi:hypothetical protein